MSEKFRPPDDREHVRIANELDQLVMRIQATADEVKTAASVALGNPVEEGVMMRPEIFELAQKIKEALEHGYTEEDLDELIEEVDWEQSPEEGLDVIIKLLHVTEEEKTLIKSIFTEKKPGRLVMYSKDTGAEMGSVVLDVHEMSSPREIADALIDFLGAHVEKNIEVQFFEVN